MLESRKQKWSKRHRLSSHLFWDAKKPSLFQFLSRYFQDDFVSPAASPQLYKKLLLPLAACHREDLLQSPQRWKNLIYFLNTWSMKRWLLWLLWSWGAQLRDFPASCKKAQLKRQSWGRESHKQTPLALLRFQKSQRNEVRMWAHRLAQRCRKRIKTIASDMDGKSTMTDMQGEAVLSMFQQLRLSKRSEPWCSATQKKEMPAVKSWDFSFLMKVGYSKDCRLIWQKKWRRSKALIKHHLLFCC